MDYLWISAPSGDSQHPTSSFIHSLIVKFLSSTLFSLLSELWSKSLNGWDKVLSCKQMETCSDINQYGLWRKRWNPNVDGQIHSVLHFSGWEKTVKSFLASEFFPLRLFWRLICLSEWNQLTVFWTTLVNVSRSLRQWFKPSVSNRAKQVRQSSFSVLVSLA